MEEITEKICEFPRVCERLLGKGVFGLKAAGGFEVGWKGGGWSGSTCKSRHAGCAPSAAARGLAAADQPRSHSSRSAEPAWEGTHLVW